MKRIIRSVFLGALLFGQQAFAQDSIQNSIQAPAKDSKQELSQSSRQKNPFRIKRFSIENFVQQVSYQDLKKHELNYSLQINPYSENELRGLVRKTPILRTLYEISADKEPFQLYNGRINLTFFSKPNFSQGDAFHDNQFYVPRKKSSPVHGLIRWLGKIRKK